MNPQTFIFIGMSGCGKGTLSGLLIDHLKKNDPRRNTLYLQSGSEFREFIHGTSFTQKKIKEIYDAGGLVPEFMAVYVWANKIVREYSGEEHVVIDGSPRKLHEAGVFNSMVDFYGLEKPFVIYLKVSKAVAVKRLEGRKRQDDSPQDIEARLAWFDTDVIPTIDFFRKHPRYRFVEVDGEREPQIIWEEIKILTGLQ